MSSVIWHATDGTLKRNQFDFVHPLEDDNVLYVNLGQGELYFEPADDHTFADLIQQVYAPVMDLTQCARFVGNALPKSEAA